MIRKPKVIVVDGTEGDAPMPTAKKLEDRTAWCRQYVCPAQIIPEGNYD